MTTATKTNPLEVLPIPGDERRWLEGVLDRLPNERLTEYDLDQCINRPGVRALYNDWLDTLYVPLIPAIGTAGPIRLGDMRTFHPIPSRGEVMEALEEAAESWLEVLA